MTATQRVEKEALKLNPAQRARLARALLASLEELPEAEVEALWTAEAERRLDEFRAGRGKPVNARAVFARARKQVGK